MVRVFIKGGVWKNSEDEILKAAVMKYGKQQWARVASLLNRKSAKQCKARWNEWLDPSVRKVEWSRAEDEKLLHLAKLMPAQWRTIGPVVGRTATQCQERYERLLDEAAAAARGGEADGGDEDGKPFAVGADGSGAAAGLGSSAPRKLRPGEIDPHPETKPARPDPVDMDEDEVEMLQEARARLANTQGKKAKRKAREKMLAEAKRLADLQKRRELKAAGLMSGQARKRSSRKTRGDIDLGVEIPFHKPAPAGFHDTRPEDDRAEDLRNRRLRDVDYRRANEAQHRARDREAAEKMKREEARLRSLERSNMKYVVAEVSKRNDPRPDRKRGRLDMPEPAVADDELRRVAKAGEEMRKDRELASGGASAPGAAAAATDALLGDYSDRPLPTPMRTPASIAAGARGTLSASEIVMREASNLRALSEGTTPLLGEENAELIEGGAGTGVELGGGSGDAATPGRGRNDDAASAATPAFGKRGRDDQSLSTAITRRDELGLNSNLRPRPPSEMRSVAGGGGDDAASVGASSFGASTFASSSGGGAVMSLRQIAREERRRAKRARKALEEALANLPAPQFEIEMTAPDDKGDDDDDDEEGGTRWTPKEKDAADVEAEELERLRKEAERLYEEQSSVLKRTDLPRPRAGRPGLLPSALSEAATTDGNSDDRYSKEASDLLAKEMLVLIRHDAHVHPAPAGTSDPIADDDIAGAGGAKGKKKKKGKKEKKRKRRGEDEEEMPPSLEYYPEEDLAAAKDLLENEFRAVLSEVRNTSNGGVYYENDDDVLDAAAAEIARLRSDAATTGSVEERVRNLRSEYRALKAGTRTLSKLSSKLQRKIDVQSGGYVRRSHDLTDATLRSFAELRHSEIEESVYRRLWVHESRGAAARIGALKEDVERLMDVETKAQKRYGDLILIRDRLRKVGGGGVVKTN